MLLINKGVEMSIFDKEVLIENISFLSIKNKVSVNKALIDSGAGKDLIANLKKGQIPSIEKLIKIADYLDVSIDYLVGRTDKPEINK